MRLSRIVRRRRIRCLLGNDGNGTESAALIRFTSQPKKTGLNLSCRWARFAFVSLRPVVLDLGVQALTLLLHFRAFFVPVNQIRTEQIEFVVQSDELTHQFVLHLAVHPFIILSYPCRELQRYDVFTANPNPECF